MTGKVVSICTFCRLKTEYFKQHKSNQSDQKSFQCVKCDKCDKTLTGYKNFMNHKKCHMTWTCENCEQAIPLNSRSIHTKRCSRNQKAESTTLSCDKCAYITNDKSHLNRHSKTHTIKEKPTFECEKCGKVFQMKKYLVLYHFQVNFCQAQFQ